MPYALRHRSNSPATGAACAAESWGSANVTVRLRADNVGQTSVATEPDESEPDAATGSDDDPPTVYKLLRQRAAEILHPHRALIYAPAPAPLSVARMSGSWTSAAGA